MRRNCPRIGLLLLVWLTATARGEEPATPLEGAWTVVSAEKNGAAYTKVVGDKFVFAGDKVTIEPKASTRKEEATFTVATAAKPNTIDFKATGADRPPRLGIYEIAGDRMKFCLQERDGRPRPTEFVSTPESGIMLVVLEREKK